MITEQQIEVMGVSTHLLRAGEAGSPILLLHGGGADSARLSWELTMPALADEHRVFAADWPGFGDSARPKINYSIDYYIDFTEALLDVLGLEKAGLVGLSLGGSVGLGFTLRHPQRVERLVLVSSYGLQRKAPAHLISYLYLKFPFANALTWSLTRRSRRMARMGLEAIFYDRKAIPNELVDQVFAEVRKPGITRAWMSIQKHEMGFKRLRTVFTERLGEIDTPTLIVHGDRDNLVPLNCAVEAYQRLPEASLRIMKDCGHWPQREKPAEFNRILKEFFSSQ